jgi:hypothetical protein
MDETYLLEELEEEFASFKRETRYKQLPFAKYEELRYQYERTPQITTAYGDVQYYPMGEHVVLRSILNRLGYFPNSRGEAIEVAHELILLGASYV